MPSLAGFQGQRQWTDHLPNGDFMEAILNSSFDWNGIRQPYIVATENDSLNGVCMLFGHLLTGTAQIFADVRTYWSPEAIERVTGYRANRRGCRRHPAPDQLRSGRPGRHRPDDRGRHSRRSSPGGRSPPKEAQKCLDATTWHAGDTEYFRGGGWSTEFLTRGGMPVTMMPVEPGQGPGSGAADRRRCTSSSCRTEVHDALDERTNPTWPTTWFVPRLTGSGPFRDVYSVMANWGANHGAFSYGHIGADLITLASMLRIPVYMHNVPEDKIYRPSAWAAFGAMDLQGADYRACANFGPLYGRY